MTDTQLYLAIGLPIIAVLTSLTVSMFQVSGIREDMRGLRADTREAVRDITAGLKILIGKVVEMDNRLTRIEERLEHR